MQAHDESTGEQTGDPIMAAPFVGHLMLPPTTVKQTTREQIALQQWIEAARAGDPVAFEHIITLHESRILGLCLRLLVDREDAKDAAQEVFLRLHRNLKKFRDGHDLSPWLYRITANVCHDLRRKRPLAPTSNTSAPDDWQESLDHEPNPEQAATAHQQHALLLAALDTLSERERDAITLRDLEELSTAEVAATLAMSEATVRSHISHARIKIRDFLNNRRAPVSSAQKKNP